MIEPLEVPLRARLGHMLSFWRLIAVIEPLEVSLRARLGHMPSSRRLVAVIEPLERALRARLGRMVSCRRLIAVIEPLEVSLRALWRQGTCQLRRSRYRVSVLENYRPREKDKMAYTHQSADRMIKD